MSNTSPENRVLLPTVSSLSSSSASFSTPSGPSYMIVDGAPTVADLFLKTSRSPPEKSRDVQESTVEQAANDFFQPIGKGWSDLDDHQKTKFSFLLMKVQISFAHKEANVEESQKALRIAQAFKDALDENTLYGRRLVPFLTKGGDLTPREGEEIPWDPLHAFLQNLPVWGKHDQAPTLFNNPVRPVNPFYRYQSDLSFICYLVVVANAIFYNMCIQYGENHDDAVAAYALNANRYMRNNFSSQETFDNIFKGSGGHPKQKLLELLGPFNPGKSEKHFVAEVCLDDEDETPESLFKRIKKILSRNGALIVEDFKPFDGFVEHSTLEFGGNYENYKAVKSQNPGLKLVEPCPMHHALLVVGVKLTNSEKMGGLAFLVQNAFVEKPFVAVGLDLLISMDVLRLLYILNGNHFCPDPNTFVDSPGVTLSGSQRGGGVGGNSSMEDRVHQCFVQRGDEQPEDKEISAFERNPGHYMHKLEPGKEYIFFSG